MDNVYRITEASRKGSMPRIIINLVSLVISL